jgi:hypothetical protein
MGVSLQGGALCARASPISIANAKAAIPDIAMQRRFMMAAGRDKSLQCRPSITESITAKSIDVIVTTGRD